MKRFSNIIWNLELPSRSWTVAGLKSSLHLTRIGNIMLSSALISLPIVFLKSFVIIFQVINHFRGDLTRNFCEEKIISLAFIQVNSEQWTLRHPRHSISRLSYYLHLDQTEMSTANKNDWKKLPRNRQFITWYRPRNSFKMYISVFPVITSLIRFRLFTFFILFIENNSDNNNFV